MGSFANLPGDLEPKTPRAPFLARARQMITGRVAVAVGWTAIAMITGQVVRLVGTLIMTRLLAPEMFGVMSIVLSVTITLTLLLDVGLRAAIIQSPRGGDPDFLNTAWTIQIIRGAVIFSIINLLAAALPHGVAAGVFASDSAWASAELPLVLAVASFAAILNGFESTNTITAERNLALKRYTIIQMTAQIAGFASMVILGLLTRSIWALVFGSLIANALSAALSHVVLPGVKNRLAWNGQARAELAKYGSWVMLSSAASVLGNQADRLVLGGLIDSGTLGLYSIALNLAIIVETLASTCVWSVFLPALSEAYRDQNGEHFRRKYFHFRRLLDVGLLGTAGMLFAAGPLIVDILYDDRYREAGNILSLLSFLLIFSRYGVTNAAYMALGKPHLTAIISIIKCLSLIGSLFIGYTYFGFYGAIMAVALHAIPAVLAMFWFNRENNLNDFRFELAVLAAWPAGYAAGVAGGWLVGR